MTITRTLSALALAAPLLATAAIPAAAQSAVDAVKAAETKRFDVSVKGDYKALDALLADDLIYVHSNGNTDGKKTFLEGLTSGRSKYKKIESVEMKARQVGELVLIDGRANVTVETNGQSNDLVLTYLDVWAKRGGIWQMIAWHSARMPAPAAAPAAAPK
jgi:ketosteroid isomerase-like protein